MAVPGKVRRVIVAYDESLYVLPSNGVEVFVLDEDVTRQFISRDRTTLWITEDTAEKIGVVDPATE